VPTVLAESRTARTGPAQTEQAHPAQTKQDETDQARAGRAVKEPVPTEPAYTEQAQTKPAQTEPARPNPAQTATAQTEKAQAERAQTGSDGFDVVARIFVCPTDDADYARNVGRRLIAAYLTVPAYAAFHRWLGRESVLTPVWQAWSAGDRKAALAAIPDSLVDELIVHGSPAACRDKVEAYANAGVTVPVMALLPAPDLTPKTLPALIGALGR
jgi:alkanesulfonate monooxygenase SsuD/methylene tetrahydromethanopterin reductase-like flavin-dependent oxidoreductase (luciferase family)